MEKPSKIAILGLAGAAKAAYFERMARQEPPGRKSR